MEAPFHGAGPPTAASSSSSGPPPVSVSSSSNVAVAPFLNVFKDGNAVDSFCLDGLDCLILGRHTNCHVLVAHPSISRHHLQIRLLHVSRELVLMDLDSVHGTWINGEQALPLTAVTAKEGDAIKLGASSRTYRVQWLSHPQTTTNVEHSDIDSPHESVNSGHSNEIVRAATCSTNSNDSACTGSHRIENDSPRILQEITVAGGTVNGMKTFNANISLQISQPNGSGEALPPRAPPPRRTPFAPLQLSGPRLAPVKQQSVMAKKASGNSRPQDAAAEVEVVDTSKQEKETTNSVSSKLWLRRCNSAPPPRLLALVPSAPTLPSERSRPLIENGGVPSAPPLPKCQFSKTVTPSAPPLRPLDTTSKAEEANRIMERSGNAQNVSEQIGIEYGAETGSAGNQRVQAAFDERGSSGCLGSLSRCNSVAEGVEEEYASDKENQGDPAFRHGSGGISGAILKAEADGSERGSSGATEVSRRPFQPLYLTSNGIYRPASPSISHRSAEENSLGLARPQTRPSSVVQNLDRMLRKLKGTANSEARREWHIVVDSTSLVDSNSFKCLKLLEGIREVRLIVPAMVIRELDFLKRREKNRGCPTKVLNWIESCMVKLPSWIHVQNSSENLPPLVTPPASPHCGLSASPTFSGNFGGLMSPTNGDHVLNCALLFNTTVLDGQVALLTDDTALKIKAMAEGLVCESAETFCDSLLSPYSERFLWAGSIAHGPSWTEKPCHLNAVALPPSETSAGLNKKTLMSAAIAMASKKHHVVEGLKKNHCTKAQGLKLVLS